MALALKPLVTQALCRRLQIDETALEIVLGETLLDSLHPACAAFTDKSRLAQLSSKQLIPTTRLPAGRKMRPASPTDEDDTGWWLKQVGVGGSLGVGFHLTFDEAVAAADPAVEYVLQPAVQRPWLYMGRKCHFRVYLLAFSPVVPEGAGGDSPRPRTQWFVHKKVWIAAADAPFHSKMTTERASQVSSSRTVELGSTPFHAELWPTVLQFGRDFVASVCAPALEKYNRGEDDAAAESTTARQTTAAQQQQRQLLAEMAREMSGGDDAASRALRECAADDIYTQCAVTARAGSSLHPKAAYQMFGVDLMLSQDLRTAVALEVNGVPQVRAGMDEELQLGLMEVVLGSMLPPDRGRKVAAADGWVEVHGDPGAREAERAGGAAVRGKDASMSGRFSKQPRSREHSVGGLQTEALPPCNLYG